MQRDCVCVAFAHINEFNEGAHCGSDAGNPACKFLVRKCASWQTRLSASRCDYKIKNAKQTCVVSPQFGEIKSGLASQSDETFTRVLVRMLRQDFFTGVEMKLSILYTNRLIGRTDQIHLDPAGFEVVTGTVLPPAEVEICTGLAIDMRQ